MRILYVPETSLILVESFSSRLSHALDRICSFLSRSETWSVEIVNKILHDRFLVSFPFKIRNMNFWGFLSLESGVVRWHCSPSVNANDRRFFDSLSLNYPLHLLFLFNGWSPSLHRKDGRGVALAASALSSSYVKELFLKVNALRQKPFRDCSVLVEKPSSEKSLRFYRINESVHLLFANVFHSRTRIGEVFWGRKGKRADDVVEISELNLLLNEVLDLWRVLGNQVSS